MGNEKNRREKGMGSIRKVGNRYYGRLNIGKNANGSPRLINFSGDTEAEVKKQIRAYNYSRNDNIADQGGNILLKEYIASWMRTYKIDLKGSSYDRLENTVNSHVVPEFGDLRIYQITSEEIQKYFNHLAKQTPRLSYSSLKKIRDALNACFKHALAKRDIRHNPMDLVNIPSEFTNIIKDDMRIFTPLECIRIKEECGKKYTNGKDVYAYGDAYILLLNTGLRLGELLGLKWEDYDQIEKTIHIKRNIQTVKVRDINMEATGKTALEVNSTKTYSGNRIISLNKNANEILSKIKSRRSIASEFIFRNTKGKQILPQQIDRTFYRILRNIGLEKTGVHTLRHTFASTLFTHKVDIKTISKILGHASVSITYNTYIHLMNDSQCEAVEILDTIM